MTGDKKEIFKSLKEKEEVIKNIITAIDERNNFLIIGHKVPDEDCISSMIAFALLLSKFSKNSKIFIANKLNDNFSYLINICKYNIIEIVNSTDLDLENITTVVICDTAKHDMLEDNDEIKALLKKKNILKIEIDHHIGGDSEYIGDRKYSLVTEASSSCELIGQLLLKISHNSEFMKKYNIIDLMTRNIILSILTGIIGDTKMGQFLKTKSEKKYYSFFSKKFNKLLKEKTIKDSNFSTKEELFNEIVKLSSNEDKCYNLIINKKKMIKHVGFVILHQNDFDKLSEQFDNDTVISVVRAVADDLAEESKKISIVAYYDNPKNTDMVQFRVRRSKSFKTFDLRSILSYFSIENGGGHEGAIGFRIPKNKIKNIDDYVNYLISGIEKNLEN
jgi:nanoRNase/pAp phosphatase (c-di-AMP/oligoRNAs hydrolase)